MTVSQQDLIDELQGLERQKADAQALLYRIDGAIQMVRGLLAKTAQTQQPATQEADSQPAVKPE